MSLTRLFHAVIETGPVPVTVALYRDSAPTGSPAGTGAWGAAAIAAATGTSVEVEATGSPKLRWEELGTAYGLTVYASFMEVDLVDPSGLVRTAFRGAFEERAYLATVTAPAHVSEAGTVCPAFVWYGMPMRSGSVPSIAPVVYPDAPTTLRLYDGLGALSERRARPSTGALFADAVCGPILRVNRHLPLYCGFDAFPPEIVGVGGAAFTRRDPRNLRFAGELTEGNAQRGDFGFERDQVERAAEGMGLVLYQHTTPDAAGPDAGGPSFRIVPRAALGGQLLDVWHAAGYTYTLDDDGAVVDDYAVTDTNILADSVTLAEEDLDTGDVPEVEGAGAVKLTETGDANLVRGQVPRRVSGIESELLASVTPVDGVFVTVAFRALPVFTGRARVRLEGVSGTTYWMTRSNFLAIGWETVEQTWDVDNDTVERTTVEPFPEAGDLWLDLLDAEDGEDAVFLRTEVAFVDANGDYVSDWVVTVSRDATALQEGVTVTLRRPPAIEVLPSSDGWVPPSAWESRIHRAADGTPLRFTTLGAYLAHDRLAQQGRPLAAPSCTVFGLHGPGRLLRFPAANLYRSGGFVEAFGVPCVAGGGLVLDLGTIQTEGDWTELTTSANAGGTP